MFIPFKKCNETCTFPAIHPNKSFLDTPDQAENQFHSPACSMWWKLNGGNMLKNNGVKIYCDLHCDFPDDVCSSIFSCGHTACLECCLALNSYKCPFCRSTVDGSLVVIDGGVFTERVDGSTENDIHFVCLSPRETHLNIVTAPIRECQLCGNGVTKIYAVEFSTTNYRNSPYQSSLCQMKRRLYATADVDDENETDATTMQTETVYDKRKKKKEKRLFINNDHSFHC